MVARPIALAARVYSLICKLDNTTKKKMTELFRMLLRFLQFAFSLIALITVSSGFVVTSYYGYTSMLGSSPVTYTQLITFLAMLYALWMFLMTDIMGLFSRPFWLFELLSDVLLSIMLLIAAIVLLCSDYVQHCGVYGIMLRCRSLNTAVVFTFLAMGAYALSSILNLFSDRRQNTPRGDEEGGMGYMHEDTPTHETPKESPSTRM